MGGEYGESAEYWRMTERKEEDSWWLFVCDLGPLNGKEQARFFREIKGYKHVDRRVEPPKVDEKKGVLGDREHNYIGGGSFLVKCFEKETFEIVNILGNLKVKWILYKCEEISASSDDDERPED